MSAADRFDELANEEHADRLSTSEIYFVEGVKAAARQAERLAAPCTCSPGGGRPAGTDYDECERATECFSAWLDRQAPPAPSLVSEHRHLQVAMDEAHGSGLRLAGRREMYGEVVAALSEELDGLQGPLAIGLRQALDIVLTEARP